MKDQKSVNGTGNAEVNSISNNNFKKSNNQNNKSNDVNNASKQKVKIEKSNRKRNSNSNSNVISKKDSKPNANQNTNIKTINVDINIDDKQRFLNSKVNKADKFLNAPGLSKIEPVTEIQNSENFYTLTNENTNPINTINTNNTNTNNTNADRCNTDNNDKTTKNNIDYITKSVTTKKTKQLNGSQSINVNNNTYNKEEKPKFSEELINKYKTKENTNKVTKISKEERHYLKDLEKNEKFNVERSNKKASVPAKANYRNNSDYKEVHVLNKNVKILSIGN